MKNKFKKLSLWSFALAFAIFAFSYILYHYSTPAGWFTIVWQHTPGKPFVTMLFAIWGVLFLFSGVLSLLIANIFYSDR